MSSTRPRVCLILEGSYPFVTGGVSSWVHQLIQAIPEVDFVLYSISPRAGQPVQYNLPENVIEHRDLVLSEKMRSRKRPDNSKLMLSGIRRMHDGFSAGSRVDFAELVNLMPAGYFAYRDAVTSESGWELISRKNQLNNPIYPFSDYFWAWKSGHDMLFTLIGAEAPEADVYHAVSTGYAGLAAVVAKLRTGRPYLLTEHGLYHKEREMEIRRVRFIRGHQRDMWIRIFNELTRLSYQYADRVISLFEYNRRIQISMGAPEERTEVIANGIDVEYFASIKREKRPGFHVGLVGRVVPIKDVKTFIAMGRIVKDLNPDAQFYCIGPTDEDSAYFEDCKTMVKSFRLTDSFHFTGKTDVREYYSFLDVLLLTSVREAQPLVILEAYCAGVPVVATRVGNIPEMLDYDDRFLAASKDPEKLARGVTYVNDHSEEMARIVARNRDKATKFYDRRSVYKRYHDIYVRMGREGTWRE
ncbi:MAG TPA: GT4 family glycosyltransferase PelF [Spirochaetia bacterium]|nr:GT4 family glycosyltransferase PelF [Spirochaetia bacterium]